MNLSERLMKAAMERRSQPETSAPRIQVSPIDSSRTGAPSEDSSSSALLPDRAPDPVDAGRIAVMKMRLPDPTTPDATTEPKAGLPLWERPFADVMREAGLATVTSLPIAPRRDDDNDDDLDGAELAKTIQMPGRWNSHIVDVDRNELHVPPLAMSESQGLADGSLRSEHDDVNDHRVVINLDDVTIDAEIVHDGPSADALLDRWTADVTAVEQDRQEKVDSLYRRMLNAVQQQPRVTFGPIDLRDEAPLPRAEGAAPLPRAEGAAPKLGTEAVAPKLSTESAAPLRRADDEHSCPQCGGRARIDIHDPMRGRIHLSCDSCFKMWQERVEATEQSDQPFMRD